MDQQQGGSKAPKRKHLQNRMSNILARIRQTDSNNNAPSPKPKKVNVRWKRTTDKGTSTVSFKKGGGPRFLDMESTETLESLLTKAITLFFGNNGCNFFGEHYSQCSFTLTDSAGNLVVLQQTLKDYQTVNNVYLSKTYFITTSQFVQETPVLALSYPSNQNENPGSHVEGGGSDETTSTTNEIGGNRQMLEESFENVTGSNGLIVDESSVLPELVNNNEVYGPIVDESSVSPELVNNNEVYDDASNGEQVVDLIDLVEDIDVTIRLRRSTLPEDMLQGFANVNIRSKIQFKLIDCTGKEETGEGIGVVRDAYTSFWREILDTRFLGNMQRVPLVVHDYFVEEWTTIGLILVKGFLDCGYFPLTLCKAFVINCLFGDESLPDKMLLNAFLKYISKTEERLVSSALTAGQTSNVFDDEFFQNILDRYRCRTKVSCMNVYGVFLELARQELVQKPYLMVCTWKNTLTPLKEKLPDAKAVEDLYSSMEPTNMKVVRLLQNEPKSLAERDVFSYLKEYVMNLEMNALKNFLYFTTGADVVLVSKIEISFIAFATRSQRRPIAHTCAPLLEISAAYTSFPDLRDEFNRVLARTDWGMDMA